MPLDSKTDSHETSLPTTSDLDDFLRKEDVSSSLARKTDFCCFSSSTASCLLDTPDQKIDPIWGFLISDISLLCLLLFFCYVLLERYNITNRVLACDLISTFLASTILTSCFSELNFFPITPFFLVLNQRWSFVGGCVAGTKTLVYISLWWWKVIIILYYFM